MLQINFLSLIFKMKFVEERLGFVPHNQPQPSEKYWCPGGKCLGTLKPCES